MNFKDFPPDSLKFEIKSIVVKNDDIKIKDTRKFKVLSEVKKYLCL